MTAYSTLVKSTKKFKTNIVIKINSIYYAVEQPDSGLSISSPYDKMVASLVLNPTTMDIRRVTTTISSFSFVLLDKGNLITAQILGNASGLNKQQVEIWLGYINKSGNTANDMAFSDYFKLPITYITKIDHDDNFYKFSSADKTERMDKRIYDYSAAIGADILVGTTIITMRDDISTWPTSGYAKIDDEFFSYASLDLVNNRLNGCIRGQLNSTPAAHAINTTVVLAETITDSPLNIIMKILMSTGAATNGTYDTLQSGLGIANTLVDIAAIEALRDSQFIGVQYTLSLYDVESALKLLEDELLMPNRLRLTTSSTTSKITLALLDTAIFVEQDDVMNEDTITHFPKWSLDGNKLTNYITVEWDYNEATKLYQNKDIYQDASSISTYGKQDLSYQFKGVKTALNGQALVDDFGGRMIGRLGSPTPEIEVTTQLDKSLQNIGDRAYLVSANIPAVDGTLNFSSDLEVISRSINHQNGDVKIKLAFTSYTNIRSAFIAPSDKITSITSQRVVGIATGRGTYYRTGWVMKLWNSLTLAYETDPINTILSISGDTITFANSWATTLTTNHVLRFADYDDATSSQKRYAFVDLTGGASFPDSGQAYKVTY